MNRTEFLKAFGLGSTGLIIPKMGLVQQPVKIYENYVKGLQHYRFGKLKNNIKAGDLLVLKREADNKYDRFAVEVCYGEAKLGYLTAYENIVLANLLDQGVQLKAFVTHINPADFYLGLSVEIFAEIVVQTQKALIPELLTKPADDANDVYRNGY
ncbi:MAG: HIRAN domain-containing protein [Vicingaceae bacterium]|nr:HIRAN domain-containing protein [Vicingaceae bacterium]